MLVRDIMTKRPTCIQAHQTLREAMQLLAELDVRHLPVIDDGEVVGMLSDRDLRTYSPHLVFESNINRLAKDLDRPVVEVMSTDVLTVEPESSVQDLIDLLVENKVGALPVLDPVEETLVGIVSYIDVLKAARASLE